MLFRHSALYAIARGVPGLINFLALAVYTRLLAPDEFGRYALAIAGISLVDALLFHWLLLVVGRFLPAHAEDPGRFLSGVAATFLAIAAIVSGLGLVLILAWPDPVWHTILALAVPLLVVQAWFQLNLGVFRARLQPARYGWLLGSKAALALGVGSGLAWAGLGAAAPLAGLVLGQVAVLAGFGVLLWRGVGLRRPTRAELGPQLRYGLPLTATFLLTWVIATSDRVLIAWLLDATAVGIYAVGYDLAQHSLGLLLAIVNTAAVPIVYRILEREGTEAACQQMAQNGALVVGVALCGAAGLAALTGPVLQLVAGPAFREGAAAVLPLVALGTALAGIKSYHFDIAFHLAKRSRYLVLTSATAAGANLLLNLLWIPTFGIVGAAYATVAAYGIALLLSARLGPRAFSLPPFWPILATALVPAAAVALSVYAVLRLVPVAWALPAGLCAGIISAATAALVVDLGGMRRAWIAKRSRKCV